MSVHYLDLADAGITGAVLRRQPDAPAARSPSCADCKFCKIGVGVRLVGSKSDQMDLAYCTAPKSRIGFAQLERSQPISMGEPMCGPGGQWFQRRPNIGDLWSNVVSSFWRMIRGS
jgi:hypothetical protein